MKAFPKYIDLYPTAIFNLNDLIYMKVIEQDVGYELEFRIKEINTLLYFDYVTGGNDYEAVQYKFIDFLSKLVNHLCKNLINLK